MARQPANPETRFWSLVQKSPEPDGCWFWVGADRGNGYGIFSLGRGRNVSAHRYAYELANGPIADGLVVCHRCDIRRCVNPAHLFADTQSVNVRDCVTKGRHVTQVDPACMGRKGEANGKAVLTEQLVRDIRRMNSEGMKNRAIARQFGLRDCLVSQVVNRRTWAHVQ